MLRDSRSASSHILVATRVAVRRRARSYVLIRARTTPIAATRHSESPSSVLLALSGSPTTRRASTPRPETPPPWAIFIPPVCYPDDVTEGAGLSFLRPSKNHHLERAPRAPWSGRSFVEVCRECVIILRTFFFFFQP